MRIITWLASHACPNHQDDYANSGESDQRIPAGATHIVQPPDSDGYHGKESGHLKNSIEDVILTVGKEAEGSFDEF